MTTTIGPDSSSGSGFDGGTRLRERTCWPILVRTEVLDPLADRGIGGRLVQAAREWAKTEGLTIVPWCTFARMWLTSIPTPWAGSTSTPRCRQTGSAPMAESCAHLRSVNGDIVRSSTGCEDCIPIR
jgi:GNAT superfamily N-acetyltransferase